MAEFVPVYFFDQNHPPPLPPKVTICAEKLPSRLPAIIRSWPRSIFSNARSSREQPTVSNWFSFFVKSIQNIKKCVSVQVGDIERAADLRFRAENFTVSFFSRFETAQASIFFSVEFCALWNYRELGKVRGQFHRPRKSHWRRSCFPCRR